MNKSTAKKKYLDYERKEIWMINNCKHANFIYHHKNLCVNSFLEENLCHMFKSRLECEIY